jgi:hypothetical protein
MMYILPEGYLRRQLPQNPAENRACSTDNQHYNAKDIGRNSFFASYEILQYSAPKQGV